MTPIPAAPCRAPYHFVPMAPELAIIDTPVFHDVQQTSDDFWSGELRCTLRTLTPLIAGNFQFSYEHAHASVKKAFEALIAGRIGDGAAGPVHDEKKILEPMRLGDADGLPGQVVIPGEAIKGAIRQSWQALLSAPMERVAERTFSFRPNLQTVTDFNKPIRKTLPALVVSNGTGKISFITADSLQDICYVHPNALKYLPKRFQDLPDKSWTELQSLYETARSRQDLQMTQHEANALPNDVGLTKGNILKPDGLDPAAMLAGWLPVVNLNGADTKAWLNQRFHEKNKDEPLNTKSPQGYRLAFIRLPPNAAPKTFDPRVVDAYHESLRHLADDQLGHLRDHPLIEGANEKKNVVGPLKELLQRGLVPGNLIFVESQRVLPNAPPRIVSVGHYFYQRQRYRDTVHRISDPINLDRKGKDKENGEQASKLRLRSVLCPHPLERPSHPEYAGAPENLTAARGLFGYVAQKRATYDPAKPNEPLVFGIADTGSDFTQFAGRISVNWAVEQPRTDEKPRFLNQDHSCLVPLRPLSAPKPSAVEMYLPQDRLDRRQDGGSLCTYGDTPDDQAAGELQGRKFYLHQPDAARKPDCYELTGKRHPDWFIGPEVKNKLAIHSDQTAIARFISAPDTQFKFTIRFRDLRGWELGALFLVLGADLALIETFLEVLDLGEDLPDRLRTWLQRAKNNWKSDSPNTPLMAMKLGHGRPLGLGSVQIDIDSIRRLRFDTSDDAAAANETIIPHPEDNTDSEAVRRIREDAILALAAKLRDGDAVEKNMPLWIESVLLPWLQVHRYAGRKSYDYPRGPRGAASRGLIYEYHSAQRQIHARGRKLSKPERPLEPGGLMLLDKLDQEES